MKKLFTKRFIGVVICVLALSVYFAIPSSESQAVKSQAIDKHFQNCKVEASVGKYSDSRQWVIAKANTKGCTVRAKVTYSYSLYSVGHNKPRHVTVTETSQLGEVTGLATKEFPKITKDLPITFQVQACAGAYGCGRYKIVHSSGNWVELM